MVKESTLTFKEVTSRLYYVEVFWNDKLVYENASLEKLWEFKEKYNDKIVYEINVKIVDSRYCILDVKGEECE